MKKTVIFVLISAFFLSILSPLSASAAYNNEISDIQSDIVYVISLDNDEVIFDKNYDKRAAPASLTKIMTALVALENCPDLTKPYTVSENALAAIAGTNSSTAGLVSGEEMSMENLLYCLMVCSANDAANVIAESISGSIPKFVDLMNQKAKALGCLNTHFNNAHGLDEDNHYTTAQDIAIITKEALKNPIFEKICSETQYVIPKTNKSDERTINTTNLMTNSYYNSYYLSYVSGIKTGTTDNAGKCIVTKASQNGYSYLAIVMGGKTVYDSGYEYNGAFIDCKKVLKWTYANIKYKVVAQEDQTLHVNKVEYCWKTDYIRLVPTKETYALVPSSLDTSSVYFELNENLYSTLKAPIKKGDVIGTATVYYADNAVATVDVTVEENVRYSFILHMSSLIKSAWSNWFGKLVIILLVLLIITFFIIKHLIKKKIIDVSKIEYDRKLKKHLK